MPFSPRNCRKYGSFCIKRLHSFDLAGVQADSATSYQAGESHIVQTLGISDPFRPKGELEAHHLVFIIACQMDDRFGETVDVLDLL